ncbi:MAG TPA: hypothetical protein VEU07_09535 [Candidatus Acidoferrum sp.]|nr:hypothetical protein [Candidatus Acidoferrum sp.]
MSTEQESQRESEAAFALLMHRYGDRLTPEMAEGLRRSVEAVVKTVMALRAVRLENGDAPLVCFAPLRKEG